MKKPQDSGEPTPGDHLTWARTRLALDGECLDSVRHGFFLIKTGFGGVSIFSGLTIGARAAS